MIMLDVASRHIQIAEAQIAEYRAAIQMLEKMIASLRSPATGRKTRTTATKAAPRKRTVAKAAAKPAAPKKATAPVKAKTVAAAATRKGTRPSRSRRTGSYVAMAEEVLAKAGKPMRMNEIVNTLLSMRPDAGKYAASAARQAITAAAEKPNSRITRMGAKGSGLYGLKG
ncbi:MAG: hypothetical protein HRF45_01885 [Fimbriimonadia bacterium]|jgi:hypothetical protein